MTVPALLLDLANTCYNKRKYSEADKYRGDELEAWVARVPFGSKLPQEYNVTVSALAAEDEEVTLTADAGEEFMLFENDILWSAADSAIIVLAETVTVTDAGVLTAIRPQSAAVTAGTLTTYAMKPLLSAMSGWIPQTQGTIADSRNRGQNLFSARGVFGRSFNMSVEGSAVRNDPGLGIIESLTQGNQRLYFQGRRAPYDAFGFGYGARQGLAIVESSSPSSAANDFVKTNYSLAGDGSTLPYLPLGMSLDDLKALCPDDLYLQEQILDC